MLSPSERRRGDQGSAMFLLPAGILVVLVLGAIVVDLSVVHLASRQAVDAATSAASDAVAAGVDEAALRSGAGIALDPGRAEAAARRAVLDRALPHEVRSIVVTPGPGPDQVTVTVELVVDPILGAALPGSRQTVVRGTGSATLRQR